MAPRLRQVSRAEAKSEVVTKTYDLLFGDSDPVAEPGTSTGTSGDWWTVFALVPDILDHCNRGFGLYRNPARKENPYRAGCIRFHGKARLVTSGPERDKAWELTNHEEQSKDPEKKGAAVIIDLDLIEQIDSSVIMKRD